MYKKLSEVTNLITRGIQPTYTEDEGAVPIVNQRCIRDFRIDYKNARFNDLNKKNIKRERFLQTYDVVVNSTGVGTLGRVAQYIGNVTEISIDSHVTLVRPNLEIIDPYFFRYAMFDKQHVIEQMGEGATGQTELSKTRLGKEIQIPVWDRKKQSAIGIVLINYDNLIIVNNKRIKILEEMAQTVYTEWFVNFRFPGYEGVKFVESPLGTIPKGWETHQLGDKALCSYISRGYQPKYDESSSCRIINQRCIRDFKIKLSLTRGNDESKRPINDVRRFVKFGDVLVNSTGIGTLGRVAQVWGEYPNHSVDSHVTIARPASKVLVSYFGLLLKSLQPKIEDLGVGATGQTELSKERIASIRVLLPTQVLLEQFSEIISPINSAVMSLQGRVETLALTRDLLIPKLISGEIDVAGLGMAVEKKND